MADKFFRMELHGDPKTARLPLSCIIEQYSVLQHHERIPVIYQLAFGETAWPSDWDKFKEFDPKGVFVAKDLLTDELVGYAISFRRKGFGYISVVAVVPAFRRRGIAAALVESAVHYLRSLELPSIKIDVHVSNTSAIHLYKKLGFETVATFED